jgi:hypothetical protein
MPVHSLPPPNPPRRAWGLFLGALAGAAGLGLPAAGLAQAQASARPPILSILDGKAQLLRGAQRLELAQGVRLARQDIIETGAEGRLVRIEFSDGLAISLGPGSRLLLEPAFVGERGRAARLYLLQGWIKLNLPTPPAGAKPATGGPALLATPAFDLLGATGSVVALLAEGKAQVFVEAGSLSLQERDVGKPVGSPQALRSGEFFSRVGSGKSGLTPRPAPDFVQSLPRSFLDTLPSRAELFKDREVAPKVLTEFGYADVRDWLTAEPSLRRASMPRWRPLTRNAAFRDALVANMAAHPEWDRVLFPEKYLPKPAAPAPQAGSGGSVR